MNDNERTLLVNLMDTFYEADGKCVETAQTDAYDDAYEDRKIAALQVINFMKQYIQ